MSDIVPPEVRPKPAVPAKPPNVGAPSPSSPFPPQGPGIGGGASALPPSAIPVPIGSHVASHAVGHNVGHGAGHVGGLAAAHNGGHGHAGAHRSGGGSTLLGYIGIDTIIEQMRKKTMKAGFDFNIMVVGKSQNVGVLQAFEYYEFNFIPCLTLTPLSSQGTAALESPPW